MPLDLDWSLFCKPHPDPEAGDPGQNYESKQPFLSCGLCEEHTKIRGQPSPYAVGRGNQPGGERLGQLRPLMGTAPSPRILVGPKDAQQTTELIKSAVESLNPRFHILTRPEQWSTLLEDSKNGKAPMLLFSWGADYADPDNVLYTLLASDGYYRPRTEFADAQIDQLLRQACTVTDPAVRAALYRQVGACSHDLAPYLLIPADPSFVVFRSQVQGITASSYNSMLAGLSGTSWRQLCKR